MSPMWLAKGMPPMWSARVCPACDLLGACLPCDVRGACLACDTFSYLFSACTCTSLFMQWHACSDGMCSDIRAGSLLLLCIRYVIVQCNVRVVSTVRVWEVSGSASYKTCALLLLDRRPHIYAFYYRFAHCPIIAHWLNNHRRGKYIFIKFQSSHSRLRY